MEPLVTSTVCENFHNDMPRTSVLPHHLKTLTLPCPELGAEERFISQSLEKGLEPPKR